MAMFDTLRTVPVQASIMAVNTLAMVPALAELHQVSEVVTNPSIIVNTGAIAANGMLAMGKLRLRNRIEDIIDRQGYDERIIRTSSISYCGRQATKMACERTGHLDEFQDTVKDPEYSKMFYWLPHP